MRAQVVRVRVRVQRWPSVSRFRSTFRAPSFAPLCGLVAPAFQPPYAVSVVVVHAFAPAVSQGQSPGPALHEGWYPVRARAVIGSRVLPLAHSWHTRCGVV